MVFRSLAREQVLDQVQSVTSDARVRRRSCHDGDDSSE